jgi:ABC-type thiamine transport system ATPase subunit
MKPTEKKKLARTILSEMAVTMLMDDPAMKSAVQTVLRKRFTELVNRSHPGAVKQILLVKNLFEKLAGKLMDC